MGTATDFSEELGTATNFPAEEEPGAADPAEGLYFFSPFRYFSSAVSCWRGS